MNNGLKVINICNLSKTQMKAPRGKGKKKGGKSKKSVQKPVNNERDGISKRPLLSPIPELPECVPTPPAPTSGVFPPGTSIRLFSCWSRLHDSAIQKF